MDGLPEQSATRQKLGFISAVACPAIWGVTPVYFHLLVVLGVVESVGHRAFWAAVWMVLCVMPFGFARPVLSIFNNMRTLVLLFIASLLVAVNWSTFLVAISANQLVETSFGYFIYPLMAIALGVVVLKETLSRWSWLAVFLATAGVFWKAVALGSVPYIALILGASFAVYALLRKQIKVEPIAGMIAEMILLAPFALVYLLWSSNGQGGSGYFFFDGSSYGMMMAISSGFLTALPLVLFHIGNRYLSLTMAGFLFFINPSLQLLLGLMVYGEPFSWGGFAGFILIWAGLIIHLFQPHPKS